MRSNITNIFFFIVLLTMSFFPSLALPEEITQDEESKSIAEYFAEPELMKLPGNYLRAVMVAYNDFQLKIKQYDPASSTFAAFSSKIDNYLITITKKKGDRNYRIWFQKKPFKGELMKGGGAIYIIDDETFKIKEKEYTM